MAERSGPSRRDALFGLAGVATGIGLAKAPLLAHTADADSPYLNPDNAIDWRHINQSTIDVDAIGMRAGGNASANARALTDAWYEGIIGKRPTPSPKLSDGLSDAIKGTALRFGAGEYRLGDFNALDTDGKRQIHFSLIGIPGSTRILLEDDDYLLDLGGFIANCLVSGIQFIGGKGFLRTRPIEGKQLGGKLIGGKYFQFCSFQDFSVCAIAGQSVNDPGYQIDRCKFTGLKGSKGLVIPGGGNHVISDNWFSGHERYSYHLFRPNRVRCTGNRHGRGGARTRLSRHDIWIEPTDSKQSAKGLLIDDLHGGEQDGDGDSPILIAQSDTRNNPNHSVSPDYGAYAHSTMPVAQPRDVSGATILGEYTGRTVINSALIKSYSQYIGECTIAPRSIEASFASLIEFAGIAGLADRNEHAQSNRIEFPPELNGKTDAMRVADRPGFGMARDAQGLLIASRAPGVSLSAPDRDSVMLARVADAASLALSAGVTARDEGDRVRLAFDDAKARATFSFSTLPADLSRVACLSFRLGARDSSGLSQVRVRIGLSGGKSLRSQIVELGTSARTVRIPFLLNRKAEIFTIGFEYPHATFNSLQRVVHLDTVQAYQL